MLGDADEASRRRPFEFLSSIFKRRRDADDLGHDMRHPTGSFEDSDFCNQSWVNEPEAEVYPRSLMPKTSHSSPMSLSTVTHMAPVGPNSSSPSPIRSSVVIATATVGIPIVGQQGVALVTSSPSSCMTSYKNFQSSSPAAVTSLCGSPIMLHQTPIKSRDIGEDIEAIRLSRQDNPYLQRVAGSETNLVDDDVLENGPSVVEEEDTAQLVSQSRCNPDSALSISEVHEHLIRSPPPSSVPKTLNGKGVFVFPLPHKDQEDNTTETNKTLGMSGKTQSLNPLLTKGHEDVLDQYLRQVLDTQRRLSNAKVESCVLSCSVPGSPARAPTHSTSLQIRKPTHARTSSEESSGAYSYGASSVAQGNEGILGPVLPPGKKQPSPSEVLLTRPLLDNPTSPNPSTFPQPLLPLARNSRHKKSLNSKGTPHTIHQTGSSSSLTLPIRCPHQPAPSKIT